MNNKSKYLSAKKYGLVYREDKKNVISQYMTDDMRFLMNDTSIGMAKVTGKTIKALVLYPSGYSCTGACDYCIVMSNLSQPHNMNMTTSGMMKLYNDIILYNKSKGRPNDLSILKFTGGEPLLNSDIYEFMTMIEKDDRIKTVEILTSLFLKENDFRKFILFLESNSFYKVKLYLSVDFGADTRVMKNNSDTSELLQTRINEILSVAVKNKNIKIKLHSVISKKTNLNTFLYETKKYITQYQDIVDCSFYVVRQLDMRPSVEFMKELCKRVFDEFENAYLYDYSLICLNKKSSFHNWGTFKMVLEDGVYKYSPFNYHCSMYKNTIVGDKNGFDSCFFMKQSCASFEEALVLDEKKLAGFYFKNLPQQCYECENVSFCSKCRIDRATFKCSEHDVEYENLRWKIFTKTVDELKEFT